MQQVKQGFIIPLLGVLLVSAFIALAFFTTYKKTHESAGLMIADHVAQLSGVFANIHKKCGILSFDFQKNPINFLNVKSFSGSQVGSMNLRHPKKWKGSYTQKIPAIDQNDFQVVRTHKGYFIAPAEGIKLPNGLIVGEDIILNDDADITIMVQDGGPLNYQGKALAVPLATDIQDLCDVATFEVE